MSRESKDFKKHLDTLAEHWKGEFGDVPGMTECLESWLDTEINKRKIHFVSNRTQQMSAVDLINLKKFLNQKDDGQPEPVLRGREPTVAPRTVTPKQKANTNR